MSTMSTTISSNIIDQDQLQDQINNGHARRMGDMENYFGLLQRQKLFKTFAVLVKFNQKINYNDILKKSLRDLFLKYPILACSILDTDYSDLTKPNPIHDYIYTLPKIQLNDILYELPQHIKDSKDDNETLLSKINDIALPYAQGNTLWKLAILDDYTMVYLSNHCLSDGITGKNVIQDLSNLFEQYLKEPIVSSGLNKDIINYALDKHQMNKLPVPLDSLVSYKPPISYFFEFGYNLMVFKFLSFKKNVVQRDDKHIYKILNIPANHVSNIKKQLLNHHQSGASDEKLTITPFIETSWLNAQYKAGLFKDTWFGLSDVTIPCDARKYLPSDIDNDEFKFGSNVGASHKFFHPVKKFNLENLKYHNEYSKYLFKTKRYLYDLGMMSLNQIQQFKNLDQLIIDSYIGQPRGNTLISNIGIINDSNNGELKVENCYFAQHSRNVFNFYLCVSSCKNGGINILITMVENTTSKENFEEIVEKFHENLLNSDKL
ncbi:Alcohol O-acetyltransferase 1 [Wickerhamomyces ciferrii]|uniref:Alcohol O-acetyltransferase 1 n=1 Tax=Wickerhamomyces ciferrii (strain ATCC 14091 / BCRC 22168 / CBS 111 / JCM 3599 / NBRC 0793 / NRRL Y-1031 F-60-10) TaxID=1206466 RepID=K0KJB4_WICCF|nr:Alcohol O-acetyltransferase 1 [Wickerhamomyces ciferrii]CCH41198.1 Alcohol O-acetyltransferase 1 [Wickerhamomyces ciferrii]